MNLNKPLSSAMVICVAMTALLSYADTLNDGLAIYLPFNEDMANKSTAASAVQSPPEPSAECANLVANGFVGKCLQITTNATSYGYLKLTGTDTGSLAYPNNKTFSAVIWLRQDIELASDPVVFGNNNWNGKAKGFIFAESTEKQVNMHAADGSNRFDLKFNNEARGIWTFYAVVSDNASFTVYQGTSAGANTLSVQTANLPNFTLATTYPFYIGQGGTGTYGKKFIGSVDDFALWTRALSRADIERIYECGRTGMELGDLLAMDANDEPTMEVVSSDNDTVALAFGGRRSQTHTLCVCYGASDGGADKYAWDGFASVADIAAGDTQYVYTVPSAFKAANTRYRFFLMQKGNLPYAKEVQYVQSNGSSYIDTGVAPRRWMTAEFDVHPVVQNGTWDWCFGAMGVNGNKKSNFGIARHEGGNWHLEVSGSNYKPCACALGETHHVKFDPVIVDLDGARFTTGGTAAGFVESGWTVSLFRNLKAGTPYDQTIKGWFETFTLYTPERTARDFKPVVDGNGTAGMFDAVTGRFYASGGTALTAGADQDEARYGWVRAVSGMFYALADNTPATATYSGGGTVPSDVSDSANWTCLNAYGQALQDTLPTSETVVTVSGTTAFAVPSGSMPQCRAITFDNAVLAGGSDWRGLDFSKVTPDSVVDVNGKTLFLVDETSTALSAFTVTDSSDGEPGTLRISVAQGATITNAVVATSGNLKVRKEGVGVFSTAKVGQTYSGGTEVMAGSLRLEDTASTQFGSGRIRISGGAVFDLNGCNASATDVVLDGGTLTSLKPSAACTLPSRLALTADSRLLFADISGNNDQTIGAGSVWNLGGRQLSIEMLGGNPDLNITESTISNGTFAVTQIGQGVAWLQIRALNGKDGLKLDLSTTILRLQTTAAGNSSVFDYVAGVPYERRPLFSKNKMEVYGTYTPPPESFGFNMMMMDGSTMNLSEQSGTWSCSFVNSGGYVNGSDKPTSMSFKENATITINLEGRTDLKTIAKSESPYIVTWATKPADTTTFVLDAATQELGFKCKVTDAGLRLMKNKGLVIIVQ